MTTESFPKPASITGGCLCGSIRYRVDFPSSHDFASACQTCQCTQCRRSTGSLFFSMHMVKKSAFAYLTDTKEAPSTLKSYRATPGAERCFCDECGSFLLWQSDDEDVVYLAVGGIDPEYLVGEERQKNLKEAEDRSPGSGGEEGREKPVVVSDGYGRALAGARDHHWCANEISGVTDEMLRGKKMERGSGCGVVLYEN